MGPGHVSARSAALIAAVAALGTLSAEGAEPEAPATNVAPPALYCQAKSEHVCDDAACTSQSTPPQAVSVDLATGTAEFCLYTFCAPAVAELQSVDGSLYEGILTVLHKVEDKTVEARYDASFDVRRAAYALASAAGGDGITAFVGTCGPKNAE
ncbi:MAG: hypothetical protein H6923_00315 [Alphaproteobacteria bacterium]|nr:hypothetical protein [Alphaproteobacteria bacterium]